MVSRDQIYSEGGAICPGTAFSCEEPTKRETLWRQDRPFLRIRLAKSPAATEQIAPTGQAPYTGQTGRHLAGFAVMLSKASVLRFNNFMPAPSCVDWRM
jgi:hypothetical protein